MSEDVVVRFTAGGYTLHDGSPWHCYRRVRRDGTHSFCAETDRFVDLEDVELWNAYLALTAPNRRAVDPSGLDAMFERLKKAEGVDRDAVGAGGGPQRR